MPLNRGLAILVNFAQTPRVVRWHGACDDFDQIGRLPEHGQVVAFDLAWMW